MKTFLGLIVFGVLFKLLYGLYSTKTAYMESFTQKQIDFIKNPDNYKIQGCEPEQIYILLRHGSRYPSTKQVEKSKTFLKDLREYRKKQTPPTPSAVDEIVVTFENEPHYRLSDLGAAEMHDIARRFRARYPMLFNTTSVLSPLKNARRWLNIKSSGRDRSIQSAHHFIKGLYSNEKLDFYTHLDDLDSEETGDAANNIDYYDASDDEIDVHKLKEELRNERIAEFLDDHVEIDNRMMRLFDECQTYVEHIKNNETAYRELTTFKNGPEVTKLIQRLKKRLNIEDMELSTSLLLKLFTLCNIETAHKMPDNWCKLFDKDDYEVLGYLNDLKSYWLKSNGHKFNSKMVFILLQDLFKEIDKLIQNDEKRHKIILRFGHAENIFPLVAALGLFDDKQTLRADNFAQNHDRQFRSAKLTPFSSNIAFVLHRCDNDELYKVHVLVNEMLLSELNAGKLACNIEDDGSLCRLVDLRNQLDEYIHDEFEQVCELKSMNESSQKVKVDL